MTGWLRGGVAPTARETIHARGPMRVERLLPGAGGGAARENAAARAPLPVLLVPSIINRATILDLREGQSLAAHLLAHGLDVFLVDWGTPGSADASLGLADYALRLLPDALGAVRRASGAERAHAFGYCLGGTFALIAAARPECAGGIASVCCLATPVDMGEPGALGTLADARLLDLESLARAFPIVPGELLWAAFQALDPAGLARKWRSFAERRGDRAFVDRFAAQEAWLADPVPVTARALGDVVRLLYRENALARGTLALGGEPVSLAAGRAPALNLIAAADGIVPPAASRALAALWGGKVETREFPGGHIGITVGSEAPRRMWAAATEWLLARQEAAAPCTHA